MAETNAIIVTLEDGVESAPLCNAISFMRGVKSAEKYDIDQDAKRRKAINDLIENLFPGAGLLK